MAAAGNNLHVIAENGDVIIFIFQPRDYYAELLQTPIPPDTPAPGTIVIRVQASLDAVQRHSAYFRELLQGQEPGATPAANQMQITDCDPELFLLAMRAVHGKSYLELPLGLDQLARLAFIVDRYKLHDVMRHYTDSQCIRVESILFTMGQINIVDLEKWIFICWVLSKHQRLNTAVRVAIKTAIFPLSSLAVPLTEHLVGKKLYFALRAYTAQAKALTVQSSLSSIGSGRSQQSRNRGMPGLKPLARRIRKHARARTTAITSNSGLLRRLLR